jgi:ABC-2 type transport system ATP-binding protein
VLLTTQYLDEADRLADRISVIDRGHVIAEGSSDELKDQLGGERLDVTLEDAADAEAAIAALEPIAAERPALVDGVLRVPIRQRKGTIAAAVLRLNDVIGIDDVAMRRPSLDEVFLTLTGHTAESEDGELGDLSVDTTGNSPSPEAER